MESIIVELSWSSQALYRYVRDVEKLYFLSIPAHSEIRIIIMEAAFAFMRSALWLVE